jgi:hypothetical protein
MISNNKKELILDHRGTLKYDTIGELINNLKKTVSRFKIKLGIYKKLLLVMIESLENILKYNENFDINSNIRTKYTPEFKIEKDDEKYFLTSVNVIFNKDIPVLENKINHVNTLDSEGLKKLYKSTITNGRFTHKGGAGLGFIEMAKISTEKIQYSFKKIDDDYSVYRLCVIIDKDFYNNYDNKE